MTNVTHKFLSMYLFLLLTLHVLSTLCSSSGETNCVNTTSGNCHSANLHTTGPPTQSDSYQRLYWHNLCVTLVIYQESLRDARSTKYKKSAVCVVWYPIILKIILIYVYIYNIKNCVTMSSFGCVEIYTDDISSLVWIEIEVYCIVHSKAVEMPCHKFSTSNSFVVVLLYVI
jgi:hypothetical protein